MEKFFIILAFIFSSAALFGQDIIVTKDAKKIDAKVLKIDDIEIKYTDFDTPDGVIYRLLKSEIASIIYQNGNVEVFNDAEVQVYELTELEEEPVAMPQGNGVSILLSDFKNMDDDDIDDFFARNVGGDIYEKFHSGMRKSIKGKKLFVPGIILIGGGLASAATGVILGIFPSRYEMITMPIAATMSYLGEAAFLVGNGLVIASIPLRAVGGARKESAKNDYIDQYYPQAFSKKIQPALNFGLTTNGVGFTVNF